MKGMFSNLTSLGSRLAVILIGAPLLLYVILKTDYPLYILLGGIIFLSWWEMLNMFVSFRSQIHKIFLPLFFIIFVGILFLGFIKNSFLLLGVLLGGSYFFLWLFIFSSDKEFFKVLLPVSFFTFYFAFFSLPAFSLLRGGYWGRIAIFYFFVLVWFVDSFAYLGGCTFRGPRLCEQVSPKKTISGFVWGFLGGVFWWAIFVFLLQSFFTIKYLGINQFLLLAISILTVFFIQLGDLLESRVKRLAKVKDSSNILPGHGGIWDRFDGFIFALPVYYYLITYITRMGG